MAGPGFLNITLDAAAQGELARAIVAAGPAYGRNDALAGQRVNLEFVSANPTGPVHIGGVRWAAVGDALARLFEASGAEVVREYYFNDHGAQIDRFARSLLAAAKNEPTPEDGYAGAYIAEIAAQVLTLAPTALERPDAEAQEIFRKVGVNLMFDEIKASLKEFGVVFDVYFHEDSLHATGAVERAMEALRKQGHIYDQDGAVWLRTTDFGDDKDRVLLKSDGEAAYFAGDAAYYLDKRGRGFDICLYLLGADHTGYVGRLKALAACAGDDPAYNIEVLIGQMVNLVKAGEPVRMSKRAGNVITLADLVEAIGVDAARYALARASVNQTIDLDLDLWTKRGNDNPIYYVQYAHARISLGAPPRRRAGHRPGRAEPGSARPRARGRPARRVGRVPPGRRERGRAARAAPDRALPGVARRRLPPLPRLLPGAAVRRRGAERPAPRPALALRGDPDGAGQRARPGRRERPGADVNTVTTLSTYQRTPARWPHESSPRRADARRRAAARRCRAGRRRPRRAGSADLADERVPGRRRAAPRRVSTCAIWRPSTAPPR